VFLLFGFAFVVTTARAGCVCGDREVDSVIDGDGAEVLEGRVGLCTSTYEDDDGINRT
jgi:hypothetical protein